MKKQLLTMVFILCAVCAEAQVIWNVKAGAGVSGIQDRVDFAWTAGVGAEIPVSNNWVFLPSFQYAHKKVGHMFNSGGENGEFLQLPIQMGYNVKLSGLNKLVVKAGPYAAYSMTTLSAASFDVGVDVGIDYIWKHYVLGIDYQNGFINLTREHFYGGSYDYDYGRATAAFLTFGYRF